VKAQDLRPGYVIVASDGSWLIVTVIETTLPRLLVYVEGRAEPLDYQCDDEVDTL